MQERSVVSPHVSLDTQAPNTEAASRMRDRIGTLRRRLFGLKKSIRVKGAYLLLLGPWSGAIVKLLRRIRKNPPLAVSLHSVVEEFNMHEAVAKLDQNGFADGIRVRQELANEVVSQFTKRVGPLDDKRKPMQCLSPHLYYPAVYKIAFSSDIVNVARGYLGVEPIMHSTRLTWALADPPGQREDIPFHFDVSDFRSLVFFVYLCDVDSEAGPHCVIEGTHKNKTLSDIFRRQLNPVEALQRFGDRARLVTGPCGTAFFEDETAWHKRLSTNKPRLILNINYVMARAAGQ
jgi:hypothetical protein